MEKQRPPMPTPPEPREYNYGKFPKLGGYICIAAFLFSVIASLIIIYIFK